MSAIGHDLLVRERGDVRLEIDPVAGGRLASLVVDGFELVARTGGDPVAWGCFPSVPYPGRIRDGTFTFAGRRVELPRNLFPHAGHGTVLNRAWTVVDDRTLSIDLGPAWPFAARVTQTIDLEADALHLGLTLDADEPMPGAVGWHPWFPRRLAQARGAAAATEPAILGFDAARMFIRDADGIPTGETRAPTQRPWDDCFTGLRSPPSLTWPGALRVELTSSCDFWVVYDEPPDTICLEPQSSPPDFVHLDPVVVEPGRPLTAWMTWRWSADPGAAER